MEPISNNSKSPGRQLKKNEKQKNNIKSIYINIEKEEDEDRELLELLNGKRKFKILDIFNFSFFKSKQKENYKRNNRRRG